MHVEKIHGAVRMSPSEIDEIMDSEVEIRSVRVQYGVPRGPCLVLQISSKKMLHVGNLHSDLFEISIPIGCDAEARPIMRVLRIEADAKSE